jgi:hypothetical protein
MRGSSTSLTRFTGFLSIVFLQVLLDVDLSRQNGLPRTGRAHSTMWLVFRVRTITLYTHAAHKLDEPLDDYFWMFTLRFDPEVCLGMVQLCALNRVPINSQTCDRQLNVNPEIAKLLLLYTTKGKSGTRVANKIR